MGEGNAQGSLVAGNDLHPEHIGCDTFYGWLATEGPRAYPDKDFDDFCVLDKGRKSVPPSQRMRMVLLPWHDNASAEDVRSPSRVGLSGQTPRKWRPLVPQLQKMG